VKILPIPKGPCGDVEDGGNKAGKKRKYFCAEKKALDRKGGMLLPIYNSDVEIFG
jgi:hypothetical protein